MIWAERGGLWCQDTSYTFNVRFHGALAHPPEFPNSREEGVCVGGLFEGRDYNVTRTADGIIRLLWGLGFPIADASVIEDFDATLEGLTRTNLPVTSEVYSL